ncbi:MAG TPA: cytochrome c [Candidatus Baltobacteraceae bacterium]|jgi:mono/diheme cytochrome c family protein|nr:cytochrome c [Candidatus Baltobacteraceae bacterium]
MLKGFILGIVFTVLATAAAGYFIIVSGTMPANADDRPPRFESWAARKSLHATLSRAQRLQNPLPATEANLNAGLKLYASDCAICHGDASGNPTDVAKGLYQKPPQLAKDGVEDDPDGITYWKLYHGIRWTGMPAFRDTLTQTQLWQLTLFLSKMDQLPPPVQAAWKRVKA